MNSVCIIGAGAAGLVTAKTLLDDGFDVQILTRDRSPGGVWAEERVYPGLTINNVHGEFRFSSLPMPPPANAGTTGGRLAGSDMQRYMESFADKFVAGRIRYHAEVLEVSRNPGGTWVVKIRDRRDCSEDTLSFDKVVLCTGGCSEAYIPPVLSLSSARERGFSGPVFHSSQFKANLDSLLSQPETGPVVVIGGGKSAQDVTAHLLNEGRRVTMIFNKADAIIAAPIPLPGFIRKSRFLAVLSPHISLRTKLERFLHTTRIGSAITRSIWNFLTWSSLFTFSLPASSPFRNAHSLFWGIRTNDEGVGSPMGFFSFVKKNKVNVLSPARVKSFSPDGKGVLLEDGTLVHAAAVVLCTGFTSSWDGLFRSSEKTREELGLVRQIPAPTDRSEERNWDHYLSLSNPPMSHPENADAASSTYRGIVPARNLFKRDFAINGAVFTTNNGYTFEVAAHWISSYFLGDAFLALPPSVNDALAHTQRTAAWLRRRYPGMHTWVNESYSSGIAFWNYPQLVDDLLEDMGLPCMRGGGNWLTWPFKVIDLKEIECLHDERKAKREVVMTTSQG